MANITKSLSDTAGFIPQAWASEALNVLRSNIVLAKLCSRDSDFAEAGWKGKTLNIPYPGTFTAQDKVANTVATVQTPSNGASTNISLTQHKTVDYIIEDVAFAQATSGINLMQAYGQAAGIAIAEQLETDLLALYSSLAVTPVGTAGTDVSDTTLRSARKVLNDNKAPQSDRFMIVSDKDEIALLGNTNLQQYFAYTQTQALINGSIGRLYGFDIYTSQLAPVVSGSGVAHSVQTLTISGAPTGGSFTLTYSGQTTGAIAYNASAAAVMTAIAALSNVGTGKVQVSGAAGGPYTVTLFLATPAAFTHSDSFTGGASPALAVADATSSTTINLAAHKNAVMLATRPLATISTAGVEVAYANDPISGISMRIQMQVKPEYRGIYVAYDILYGMAALRPSQGLVMAA